MAYRPLRELLSYCDVVFTCLNKNVILMGAEEFAAMGDGKILFNTSIGPSHEPEALADWLDHGNNYFVCDTAAAAGDVDGRILHHPNTICANVSAGRTRQAFVLLSQKVLANLETAAKALS